MSSFNETIFSWLNEILKYFFMQKKLKFFNQRSVKRLVYNSQVTADWFGQQYHDAITLRGRQLSNTI